MWLQKQNRNLTYRFERF